MPSGTGLSKASPLPEDEADLNAYERAKADLRERGLVIAL
jgi:hypothetical protein